jgi:hypothetical protein
VAFAVTVAELTEAVPVAEDTTSLVASDEEEELVSVGSAATLLLMEDKVKVPLLFFDVLVSNVVGCRVALALVLALVLWPALVLALVLWLAVVELAPPPPVAEEAIVQEVAAPFPSSWQLTV